MRKLKKVLRLHSLGLSQHQIARGCSISQSAVREYLSAAQAAGVHWPLLEDWGDSAIERALFPQRPAPAVWRKHPESDWAEIGQELRTHKDLTLQLVWQEQREANPDGGYRSVLRSLAAVAEETGLGAAAGASCRRKDVRGLHRGHDSRSTEW
ncbi:MAG TPA: hypothetical protein VKV17_01590 [Bryobacteraceae bacterium]|nr:hypothetical protein [Bryobacteraceae bacterium]